MWRKNDELTCQERREIAKSLQKIMFSGLLVAWLPLLNSRSRK
jgi:hypothetical protein